jgi:hypothetical protein
MRATVVGGATSSALVLVDWISSALRFHLPQGATLHHSEGALG